ncbi:unnamed protein product [Haemonchus placei]|uniref:Uncharacterized protein n=1 Tax=Haemonchus placei TaxID=6290 RepID=A0A0N4WNG7_HAEPC|nr:unnamed protein product [Haemonchus placei]
MVCKVLGMDENVKQDQGPSAQPTSDKPGPSKKEEDNARCAIFASTFIPYEIS